MENDYNDKKQLLFVKKILKKYNFINVYSKPLSEPINYTKDNIHMKCMYAQFFEVWIRK